MSIVIIQLMCHAPIVIPDIGTDRSGECEASTQAMRRAAGRIIETKPDAVIVVSPHTPRLERDFAILGGKSLRGDFSAFGVGHLRYEFENHSRGHREIAKIATSQKFPLSNAYDAPLDHGALVPLHFMQEAGWRGPTMVMGFPFYPTMDSCQDVGKIILEASVSLNEQWAMIASGDMSHKLTEGAPAGFHPKAKEFDQYVSDCLKENHPEKALTVNSTLRELAAEDVIDSLAVAFGATSSSTGNSFYSYEGPFGVGYLIGQLYKESP